MNWKNILTAGVLVSALTVTSAAAITVDMAGTDLTAVSYVENNTTYVPIRAASQQLGNVAVSWEQDGAWVRSDTLNLTAKPGEQWLEANGRCFYIRDGVKLRGGSVMVPVRVLAAAMGGSVEWSQEDDLVRVHAGSGVPVAADYNESDLYWLSRIISAESKGEPLAGKLAVGAVILNRVASDEFPDTIYDVIFDQTFGVQFTPVSNGTIYDEPTRESVAAAKLVLEGTPSTAGKSLYFLASSHAGSGWAAQNRPYVTAIGNHLFYA